MNVSELLYLQVHIEMFMKGLSYGQLAYKLGMSYASVRRKMKGIHPITLDEALAIKKALGSSLPLEELFSKRSESL